MVAARPENPPAPSETTPEHPPSKPDDSSMMMPPPPPAKSAEESPKNIEDQPTSDVKVAEKATEHQHEVKE